MEYHAAGIRNIALLGHGGDGKTSLTEAILFVNGQIDRLGKTEDGTTVSDFDPEEIKRHISISASVVPALFGSDKINLIDCPGYFDFAGEVTSALSASDGAVIVVSGVSGMNVGCEKAMDATEKQRVPRILFINQMDREHASFEKTLVQLKEKYGSKITPLIHPIMKGESMTGFVSLVRNLAYTFDGEKRIETDIPADIAGLIAEEREGLMESAAGNAEDLMETYFAQGELTPEEITRGISIGITDGSAVPVLCGSAIDKKGVKMLEETILEFIPSAAGKEFAAEDTVRICAEDQPFSAYVFKTVTDPFVGKLSLLHIRSGVLRPDTALYNANSDKPEKVGTIYTLRGKKQQAADALFAGDIGALAKLQYTYTGDTLCTENHKVRYPMPEMPRPSLSMAVYPAKQGDEDKVFGGLKRLAEEDLTIRLEKNEETNESLLCGLGELHLEIVARKLKNKFNTEMQLKTPIIPYRETIRRTVKAQGKHKKQSGGHGQYGDCWVEFSPMPEGTFEFVDKVVGGAVPRQYIPAVEKGLQECIRHGVLAGYPVVGLRCTLYDGSYHDVDSSEMAFKIAASLAFKQGCSNADPVLLEPVYHVEVTVPDDFMGDVIGDLNKRRGRILGMTPVAEGQRVEGEVPLSEMDRYATDLRSMTQARGSFEMRFERYEEVPENNARKIIEASGFYQEN